MKKVDDYILIQLLGKGTFGEVYLSRKDNSNLYYATKKMKKELVENPNYKKYFRNEITILRDFKHKNIIRLMDLKRTTNNYYIITEYCNGGSLTSCLKKYKEKYHRPFTEEIVQHIMRQILSAVNYLHSSKIVHRDLKLDNILVNFFNEKDFNDINLLKAQIKLIDFGFASHFDESKMFSTIIGSPMTMDPLILKKFNNGRTQSNDLLYDEKADIWSLGALCYQMLIRENPFDAYNMQELVDKIEEGNYSVPANLSEEVISFLNGMLQYESFKRLSTQSLLIHPFLSKSVEEFSNIKLSKNTFGGKIHINIKNNESIWSIFNKTDQNILNKLSINYDEEKPISDMSTLDNTSGLSKNNTNSNNSTPLSGLKQNKNEKSTLLPKFNKNLNPPNPNNFIFQIPADIKNPPLEKQQNKFTDKININKQNTQVKNLNKNINININNTLTNNRLINNINCGHNKNHDISNNSNKANYSEKTFTHDNLINGLHINEINSRQNPTYLKQQILMQQLGPQNRVQGYSLRFNNNNFIPQNNNNIIISNQNILNNKDIQRQTHNNLYQVINQQNIIQILGANQISPIQPSKQIENTIKPCNKHYEQSTNLNIKLNGPKDKTQQPSSSKFLNQINIQNQNKFITLNNKVSPPDSPQDNLKYKYINIYQMPIPFNNNNNEASTQNIQNLNHKLSNTPIKNLSRNYFYQNILKSKTISRNNFERKNYLLHNINPNYVNNE